MRWPQQRLRLDGELLFCLCPFDKLCSLTTHPISYHVAPIHHDTAPPPARAQILPWVAVLLLFALAALTFAFLEVYSALARPRGGRRRLRQVSIGGAHKDVTPEDEEGALGIGPASSRCARR